MTRLGWALLVVSVVVFGCGPKSAPEPATPNDQRQPYRDAIAMVCDVDQRAGLTAVEDPLELGQRRTDYLTDNIKNPDAIYFRTMISVESERDQAKALRNEAKKVGLARCALADSIEEHAIE